MAYPIIRKNMMMKLRQYQDNCTYVVKMEGIGGNIYETECLTPKEAVKLETHHQSLGWNAWIEIKKNA